MTAPLADSNSLPADGEVARYRAVSAWAIAALLLGLLSPLAFVGPVLWSLPLLCIAVALVAMWKISASAGELVGWSLALLGLLLALLFGLAAPAHTLTRQYWLESRAEAFADEYIELLRQGRPFAAYQLMLYPTLRKPLNTELPADYDKDPRAKQKYERFLQAEPALTLLAQRDRANFQRLSCQLLSSDDESDRVALRYRISPPQTGAAPVVIQLTVLRFLDGKTGREQWRIKSADVVE